MRKWNVKTISVTLLLAMLVALTALVVSRRAQAAANLTVYSQNFWHDYEVTGGVIDRYLHANFGVEFDFRTNYKSKVMLLSFLLYEDEAVPDASYCLSHNGVMPPAHPERPFWSSGFATQYSQGRNFYSQTYRYSGSTSGTSHLVSWLEVMNSNGTLQYCAQKVYELSSDTVYYPASGEAP